MRHHDGREAIPVEPEELRRELRELAAGYDRCLVDVGTGDGRFVLREARDDEGLLAIGLDAVADALAPTARKAKRKATKGGAPNARFLVAAAEELPGPLEGLAHRVTVNFPWGSLLRGMVVPSLPMLQALAGLAQPGAELVALLNMSIFRNTDYLQRLGLPTALEDLETRMASEEFAALYAEGGWSLTEITPLVDAVPHQTSWGQRLVRGSRRRTVLLRAVLGNDPTTVG